MGTSLIKKSEFILSIISLTLLLNVFLMTIFTLNHSEGLEEAAAKDNLNHEFAGLVSNRAANMLQDEIGGATLLVFVEVDENYGADRDINLRTDLDVFTVDRGGERFQLYYNPKYKMFEKELEPFNYSEGDRFEIEIEMDREVIWHCSEEVALLK